MAKLPDLVHVTLDIAKKHPETLRNARKYAKTDKECEFLDRCIQKLHSIDPRFGYRKRKAGHRRIISDDFIAYDLGKGRLALVDFIRGISGNNPHPVKEWHIEPWSNDPKVFSEWVYPRPNMPDYGYHEKEKPKSVPKIVPEPKKEERVVAKPPPFEKKNRHYHEDRRPGMWEWLSRLIKKVFG